MTSGGTSATVQTVPTGNTYDKYGSTNPVVRKLMARFERDVRAHSCTASRSSVTGPA